ncbi:MAG: bifunctional adenosylcobinamide kinase/adenosylcobinamide-phosphate guanylyltransferase [Gemmiger sp.]|nr:bifunctional adenosylcobinamide kinase/adenosylcobinamide-phosphate guanylyltransferase [Gemmiger sp.]
MIFITGPLYSGKKDYAKQLLGGITGPTFEKAAVWDVQALAAGCQNAAELNALAARLAENYSVVIATEVGGGVVPIDAAERAAREAAGRLACLLAARATRVVRVLCGIPILLKGEKCE